MPMLKRPIQPSSITRASDGKIPGSISNELEYVANSTQANLIRQLSSLSQHAEDMFRELFVEATTIFERTCNLSNKVDSLRDSVQQFDPNQVVVKLTDITKKKPYKTEYHTDQQICTKNTMPSSLQHMYNNCAPPPRLDKFDKFRTDGKKSIKLYTDPDYFVQLWVESLQKNVSETSKKHDKQKVKRDHHISQNNSQRPSGRTKGGKKLGEVKDRNEKYVGMARGKEFMPEQQKQSPRQAQGQQGQHPQSQAGSVPNGDQRQSQHPGQTRTSQGADMSAQRPSEFNNPNGGYPQHPPAPPAPIQSGGGQANKYQEMIYDDNTKYNVVSDQSRPGSQFPPPFMAQSNSNTSDLSRASVVSHSPSMNRMTMPPPPPPPNPMDMSTHSLPPPPSPPQELYGYGYFADNVGIVPPPPPDMMHSSMAIRPASPPPPLSDSMGYIPTGVPPPPQPLSPPHRASHYSPPPAPQQAYSPAPAAVPAPPPPPPPPPPPGTGSAPGLPAPPPAPAPQTSMKPQADMLSHAASKLRSTQDMPKIEPVKDERSGLLSQIRLGIQLRGAEERKQHETSNSLDSKKELLGGLDVQSIMDKVQEMRRHMENSDSESDSYDEWDDSDDD